MLPRNVMPGSATFDFSAMTTKNTPFAKALSVTAASTTALFALQHNTEASVVYTDPNPDLVLAPAVNSSGQLQITIKGPGPDFRFVVANHESSAGLAFMYADARQFLPNASGGVRKLAAGAAISAGAGVWGTGGGDLLRRATTNSPYHGTWRAGQTGFAAIRFSLGNNNYDYGWIRMRVDDVNPADGTPDTLTIFDYAYDDTPNQAITSGQTTDNVPEPSAAALLALAGAGAAFLRRKRKSNCN